jgi:hypothetical protein
MRATRQTAKGVIKNLLFCHNGGSLALAMSGCADKNKNFL